MPGDPSSPHATAVRRIGVVLRTRYRALPSVVDRLEAFCAARGVDLRYESTCLENAPRGARKLDLETEPPDIMLALGGDGTLLRAARLAMGTDIPLLGINLGQLGFLTSTAEAAMEEGLARLVEGDYVLDRRISLQATVRGLDGSVSDREHALNDFVVHASGAARVTPLHLVVGNGEHADEIGSFSADGVILATPTGSTAYSLSAGGPIVVPGMECVVVTAICPHSLAVRPLVVPVTHTIIVRPLDPNHELQLDVDGQVARDLAPGDVVVVERGEPSIPLIRLPGQSFFRTMRRKLNWAVRPPDRS